MSLMSKRNFLLFLGVWIIIIPLSGLPTSWKTGFLCLTGSALIALAILGFLKRGSYQKSNGAGTTFVESKPGNEVIDSK